MVKRGWRGEHGASAYRKSYCRCEVCTDAHRERYGRERDSRKARLLRDPTLVEHGKVTTYTNWKCRCRPCVQAHADYLAGRRKGC